jgi:glycosyltransferase involved in cell wall biosynthesis
VFVPPGDADALAGTVRELAGRQERCQAMGHSARAYVETHFDRREQAEKLEATLERVRREGKL